MNTRHITSLVAAGAAIVMLLSGCGSTGTSNSSNASDSNIISVYGSEPAHPLFPGNTTEPWRQGCRPAVRRSGDLRCEGRHPQRGSRQHHLQRQRHALRHQAQERMEVHRRHSGDRALLRKRMELHRQQCQQAGQRQLFSTIEGYDDLQKPDVDPKATLSGLTVVDDNTIDVKLSQPDSAFPVKAGSHATCRCPNPRSRTRRSSVSTQ